MANVTVISAVDDILAAADVDTAAENLLALIAFGGLSVTGGAATQTGVSTSEKITQWTTNDLSANTTPDHTADTITVAQAGTYLLTGTVSFSGTANKTFIIEGYNETQVSALTNCRCERKLGTGGDVGCVAIHGIFTAAASDAISLHVSADTGDFSVTEGSWSVRRIA